MRVLLATGSPPGYMLPPQLGDEQVNCGPDWPDETGPDGRVRSIRTPAGPYDLTLVAAKLPPGQEPDIVACLVDSSRRSLPRNLSSFRCPRVLLLADTHHLGSPLIGALRYIASEPYTRVVVLYDRHHASFLMASGLRDLHWFPGLTFPHGDAAVRAARRDGSRASRIAFVGQVGKHHPRRPRLFDALKARGLPLSAQPLPQVEALGFYGASLVGLNASLNGDLNLRTFEILAAGGALLTDRLAPSSGLGSILADGREMATYGSPEEMVERAAHLIAHPGEALAMGVAGAEWFDQNMGEARRRAAFRDLAFDGTHVPGFEFSTAEKTRVYFGGNMNLLLRGMMVYEAVQEIHRLEETVQVALDEDAPAEFGEMCATLPRVGITEVGGPADLSVVCASKIPAHSLMGSKNIWCWDIKATEVEGITKALTAQGFTVASRDVALFTRSVRVLPEISASSLAEQGRALFTKGDLKGALEHGQAALAKDTHCVPALVLIGELALAREGAKLAERVLSQAMDLRPGDPAIELLLGDALCMQGKLGAAAECFKSVLESCPNDLRALLAFARLRAFENDLPAAVTLLRHAARNHPASAVAMQELGNCLKKGGALLEALQWHRRALGYRDAIPLPRTGARRRALFVAQHPSTWTSMASIHEAFRADPRWETTLVALPYNHPYFPDAADREAIFGFLEKEGLPFVRWNTFELKPDCADVVFLQNPYDITRPSGWRTQELMRVIPRIAYAPYAIEIGGTSEDTMYQFNQPLQNLAWAVFARSEEHRALFAKHGRAGNAHVIATGHPKFDLLCSLPPVAPDSDLAAFARGRPVVLWNPHFDVRPDGSGYSTFLTWWKFLPEECARRPDMAFIIRPHPLFFTTLEARKLLTREQIDGFLKACADAGNVLIDRGPSYLGVFAIADAIVSDGASFLIEFGATGKPVCYLHNPKGPLARLDYEVDLAFVREKCAWALKEDDLRRFLDGVRRVDARELDGSAASARRALSVNPDGAGRAIRRAVDARLDAELQAMDFQNGRENNAGARSARSGGDTVIGY